MRTPISGKARQRGQSSMEYTIVCALAVLVLIAGGSSSPINELVAAIRSAYEGFAYAISYATNLMAL